jgi:hypothetical protein
MKNSSTGFQPVQKDTGKMPVLHQMNLSRITLALTLTVAQALYAADPPAKGAGAGLGQERVTVDAQSEQLIKGALKYMASKQNGNGSWAASEGGDRHEVAMTGYVLMAFMSAGQVPDEGEYGRNVTQGVTFLLNCIQSDGFIKAGNTNMYGHGIASIALAEAYGQTKDPRMKNKVEAAIKLIINCQNDQGGWRYPPRVGDADLSVTVLQVVALRAAKNSGLEVPQATIDRAVRYVQSCYDPRSGGFTYQPHNQQPGFARTAAAVYSLQVCGQYDDPHVKTGMEYLFRTREDRQWFTYGHFYAAPAMYMIGGDNWERWYDQMKTKLIPAVKKQGDLVWWEPTWDGGGRVGAIYSTAVYTMILAMPYHYVPLYQR